MERLVVHEGLSLKAFGSLASKLYIIFVIGSRLAS